MKTTLFQFNPWWENKEFTHKSIERTRYSQKLIKSLDIKDIIFLIGLRRVGKTTLMKQLIQHLLKTVEPNHILYISCEHPAFDDKNLIDIIDEYRGYFQIRRDEKIFVFLDEIQLRTGFERDLKILYDHEEIKIYCSGSSATLIRDKKAYLTGRHRFIEIEPLDFNEFLVFKDIKIAESEKYLYKEIFIEYMKTGGLPEYVLNRDPEYLLNLIDSVLYKDIVSVYGLKNPKIIRNLFILLCERVGKPLSYNKLSKVLGISIDTVMQYVSYFEESFLVYIVNKYAKSLNERIRAPKKIYMADVGLRNIIVGFRDIGAIFENLVFLRIKKDKVNYYITDDGREIDFFIKEKDLLIEAKFKDKIEDVDLAAIDMAKVKNKIVAKDYSFFIGS